MWHAGFYDRLARQRTLRRMKRSKCDDLSQGSLQLARAIEEARATIFEAPWVKKSDNPEQEKAAGERQLKHQLSSALDQGFIMHDVRHPELRLLNQHNQFGLVNPDNRYHIANIETPGTYTLRGVRGSSADLQIQVGAGDPGFEEGETNLDPVSLLSLDTFKVAPGEPFEITISDSDTGGYWLSNTSEEGVEAKNILIRESFMDWNTEVGTTWYLERSDTRGMPNPPPDPELINHQYWRAAHYLKASVESWIKLVTLLRVKFGKNKLSEPAGTKLPGQFTCAGIFPMDPDEAVIITLPRVPARYQSVQSGDLWFNGLDYGRRQTSLNLAQARRSCDDDGREVYHMVLTPDEPGVANWLDPAGASTAFVYVRWQGLDADHPLTEEDYPTAKVVAFNELREHLPDSEPVFTAEDRREQLAARQRSALRSPRGF